MVKKIWVVLFMVSLVFGLASCGIHQKVSGVENGVYSRYNLHYIPNRKGINVGSYANWTGGEGHAFVPYNTKITVNYFDGTRFEFVTDKGTTVLWRLDTKQMGMTSDEYINLIMSPNPVKYEGLSDIDRQGIQAGKALPGMSKQGVMVALGYPAKHKTPSLEDKQWTYWANVQDWFVVSFDDSGKVVSSGNVVPRGKVAK